jgi:hypothetical protein
MTVATLRIVDSMTHDVDWDAVSDPAATADAVAPVLRRRGEGFPEVLGLSMTTAETTRRP